jgi:hypothetical protein
VDQDQAGPGLKWDPISKIIKTKIAGRVAHEALSSTPTMAKRKKKRYILIPLVDLVLVIELVSIEWQLGSFVGSTQEKEMEPTHSRACFMN